jgi:uncharacterized protein
MKGKAILGGWMAALLSLANFAAAGSDLRLVEAVKNKDQESVRSLLEQHVDVNAPEGDGATALEWAAHWDDLDTADLLIRAGANVNAANDYGATPLMLACDNGSPAMAERLLKAGANPNVAKSTGETALMSCARTGNLGAVKLLLDHGAEVNAREPLRGQTALVWAIGRKRREVVKLLIEHKADVRARTKEGFTPLYFAAEQGDVESARILLAAGADVNAAASNGMTPLVAASAGGNQDLLAFLLDHGSNPNAAAQRGFTALHFAASRRNMLQAVKSLLAHGANPNLRLVENEPYPYRDSYQMSQIGATPLLLAAAAGNADVMRALAAGGADPNLTTDRGTTALMMAAGLGYRQPLTDEQYKGAQEAVKVAVELGCDVNAAGENSWTALHGAASVGLDAIVQYLVEHGARMDVKDNFGQTPLSIAEAVITVGINDDGRVRPFKYFQSTSELLLKLGATPVAASGVQSVGSTAVKAEK